jgi:hypothetical protein
LPNPPKASKDVVVDDLPLVLGEANEPVNGATDAVTRFVRFGEELRLSENHLHGVENLVVSCPILANLQLVY